jgi:hypothetical protein
MKNKVGFRVSIRIERYVYDPAVGTHEKLVLDPNVESPHGNWTLKDYCATIAEADAIIASMVQSKEHTFCCPQGENNASNSDSPQSSS